MNLNRRALSLFILFASSAMKIACAAPASTNAEEAVSSLLSQMTAEEKQSLLHGLMIIPVIPGVVFPQDSLIGAGYVPGVKRLNIPPLKETDASLGVSYVSGLRKDGATALPSSLAMAAAWDPALAHRAGVMLGTEAGAAGFNVILAGGVNLVRDPRNGRNFEYYSEDPLLSGVLAGQSIAGIQSQHVLSTVKHFAVNDYETGRTYHNAVISNAAARESDLLAFELAIEIGHPGAVMCGYNRINGPYACGSNELLNKTLKKDWGYKGFVMSDWGAVKSADFLLSGLDQQSGAQLDEKYWFREPLSANLKSEGRNGKYSAAVDESARRILTSMYAVGLIDHPQVIKKRDVAAGAAVAQAVEENGIVLLKNARQLLPLPRTYKNIVVVGGHADEGVISGGGSSQVAPEGGPAFLDRFGKGPIPELPRAAYYMPSAPLDAMRALAKNTEFTFVDSLYPEAAAAVAKRADAVIVFATKWATEGEDHFNMRLPYGQDAVIAAVAASNPNTVVVLETPGAVEMPWHDQVAAIVEAWYPGIRGGEAIANILYGAVAPSGRLPVSFPVDTSQLPRPSVPGAGMTAKEIERGFDIDYNIEGSDVGYRWFARTGKKPRYAFGHGLTYTSFGYRDLTLTPDSTGRLKASFTVINTGEKDGTDTPQLYLLNQPNRTQQRLAGWDRVTLKPGESKTISVDVDPRLLANWDEKSHSWKVDSGRYRLGVGSNSEEISQTADTSLSAASLAP